MSKKTQAVLKVKTYNTEKEKFESKTALIEIYRKDFEESLEIYFNLKSNNDDNFELETLLKNLKIENYTIGPYDADIIYTVMTGDGIEITRTKRLHVVYPFF